MSRRQAVHVALDLGTHKAAVLVATMEGSSPEVIGLGTAQTQGLRRGVVVNIDATVQAIQTAVREAEMMADCQIRSAAVSLSGNHVRGFNSHGMVPIKGREVTPTDVDLVLEAARAVALPMDRQVLHVLPQEYSVDDQEGISDPEGISGVRLEARAHVLTGSSTAIQNVIKCCNRAGLDVSEIVLGPLASAQAVLSVEERSLGVGMLDIGGGTTDLMVYKGGAVQHTAVLGLGGTHLTNDIATGLNTPANEAEKLKHRFGCAVASSVPQEERIEVPSVGGRGPRVLSRHILAEIIEPRVEEILTLVSKEISRAGVDGMLSSGIVLTGGTAGLQRIAALAERVFRLPIRVGMPTCPGNLADILRDPAYSTGVGLLQLAAEGSFEALNVPVADSVIARMRSRMGDWLREFF